MSIPVEPAATQWLAAVQLMPLSASMPLGTDCVDQAEPALVVATLAAVKPELPTAIHVDIEVQATPESDETPVGSD
jgi:hypothetical protein